MTPKKLSLFCVIQGENKLLLIEIERTKFVGNLQEAIHSKKQHTIFCDANQLDLYLAKKENEFLPSCDARSSQQTQELINDQNLMKTNDTLSVYFRAKEDTTKLHVIVKRPEAQTQHVAPDTMPVAAPNIIQNKPVVQYLAIPQIIHPLAVAPFAFQNQLVAQYMAVPQLIQNQPLAPAPIAIPSESDAQYMMGVPNRKKQRLEWQLTKCERRVYDPKSLYFLLQKEDVTESGLLPGSLTLYCRPAFHKQFEFLYDAVLNKGQIGYILGPPGTGKSTTAMAFALTVDRSEWLIIWLHVEKDEHPRCVCLIDNEKKSRVVQMKKIEEEILNNVCHFGPNKKQLLIIDGVVAATEFSELTRSVRHWFNDDCENRRLAFVCSAASRGKVAEGTTAEGNIKEFFVYSWTLNEYFDVIKNPDFCKEVAPLLNAPVAASLNAPVDIIKFTELVELKYHYAGGSCRYMFNYTVAQVEELEDPMTYSSARLNSSSCINRLYAMFENLNRGGYVSRCISRYAATLIGITCGPDGIKKFMSAQQNNLNPALNGWRTEMVFFSSLTHGSLELVDAKGNLLQTWQGQNIVSTDEIPVLSSPEPVWIKPAKWNQGGYDAIM
ncbi:crinkler (CRN) family protein, partial [Thraustotheca clavata]